MFHVMSNKQNIAKHSYAFPGMVSEWQASKKNQLIIVIFDILLNDVECAGHGVSYYPKQIQIFSGLNMPILQELYLH